MPFSRITLGECYSQEQVECLSDILHQTLVDTFAVPPDDRFQIIEKLPATQRVYDAHYQSGTRSDHFILLQIIAGRPRSHEQKQSFYRTFSERLARSLAIPPDDVMVIIQFNQAEDWSFSRGEMYSV